MKHTKKLLALFLSFTLALSLALPALAAEDELPSEVEAAELDEVGGEPVPTHITAEWNGKVALTRYSFQPDFDDVKVTLHFEEGEPQLITPVWRHCKFELENGVVTVTYNDMQTSFEYPENFIEVYISQQETIPELVLDQRVGSYFTRVTAFTPKKSREFHFIEIGKDTNQRIMVLNAGMEVVADGTNHVAANLAAGETYYVLGCEMVKERLSLLERLEVENKLPDWYYTILGMFSFSLFWVGLPVFAIITAPITLPIIWIKDLIGKL